MYGLFSSCDKCSQRYCIGTDWSMIGHLTERIDDPLSVIVELHLRAPCGEEGRIWSQKCKWKDIVGLDHQIEEEVREKDRLWKEGYTFTVETDLGVARVCKDGIIEYK